ncbi:MAG: hypothetical protein ACLQVG_14525 [Terriglobia bacterium]
MNLKVEIQEVDTPSSIKAVGITAVGQYSLSDLFDLFDRVKEESEKRGTQGVILDITAIAGTIPCMDMYLLSVHCCRVLKLAVRIAIVSPDGEANNFFQNVTRDRGLKIAVVPNRVAAIKWINRDR